MCTIRHISTIFWFINENYEENAGAQILCNAKTGSGRFDGDMVKLWR